jgi:xanthine dehydrogenase accessory factor
VSANTEVLVEAGRLAAEGSAYALATVVRVVRPASARPGDRALVTPDGALSGWIGGACAEPAVVTEALRALADGRPRLVLVCRPGAAGAVPEGVVVAETACASEGTVEVLIEPQLPDPLLAVVGDSPAAHALADLARRIGWRVTAEPAEADAVVIATMGRDDEAALRAALGSGAGYVGLVASARRGAVIVSRLRGSGVDEESLARVRCPAGLDLGPSSQEEIAVAILAELVAWRHTRPAGAVAAGTGPAEAVDPVCGMTVAVGAGTESTVHGGVMYYFCCAGCRRSFEADPGRYLSEVKHS